MTIHTNLPGAAPKPDATPGRQADGQRRLQIVAVAALTIAGAVAGFTLVWNFDIFWHLACGEWMVRQGRVLASDPFSVDGSARWVNVHWLFQLVVAGVHCAAGFAGLTVMKSALAAAMVLTLGIGLRKIVPPAWLIASGLAALLISLGRIRVRPEAFTLVFLAIALVLTDNVRRGGPARRLWWMTPIMLVWVNMHGLYVLGLFVLWGAMAGAWLDRLLGRRELAGNLLTTDALAAGLAASVACLLTPWPIEAFAQPLLLWQRISGQAEFYTYGVSEFRPTWQMLSAFRATGALVALAVLTMILNAGRTPMGHVIWMLAFVALATLARRNVGLIGPLCGFVMAVHGGSVLRRIGQRTARLARAVGPVLMGVALLAVATVSAGFVTGEIRRRMKTKQVFAAGLQRPNYQVAAAKFLPGLDANANILCENFGDSGVFIYYASQGRSQPRRLVYMDGRLEAHSLERFKRQSRIRRDLQSVRRAGRSDIPETVRFIVVRHDSAEALAAMMASPRFALIFIDQAGAVFARNDYPGPAQADELPQTPNFSQFWNTPAGRAGSTRISKPQRWYSRNPWPLDYQIGLMFLALGWADPAESWPDEDPQRDQCVLLAMRYLSEARSAGLKPAYLLTGSLARAYQQWAHQHRVVTSASVPVEINVARCLYLYRQPEMEDLAIAAVRRLTMQMLTVMLRAGQLDAALSELEQMGSRLGAAHRVNPPREYSQLREAFSVQLAKVQAELSGVSLDGLDSLGRATLFASRRYGLIDRAISELRGAVPTPDVLLKLGDLLLAKGLPRDARSAYAIAHLPPQRHGDLSLRLAICDWVQGDAGAAMERAARSIEEGSGALGQFYLAVMYEQMGRRSQLSDVLASATTEDPHLALLLRRIRRRSQATAALLAASRSE